MKFLISQNFQIKFVSAIVCSGALCVLTLNAQTTADTRVGADKIEDGETQEASVEQASKLLEAQVTEMVQNAQLEGSELSAFLGLLLASNEWQHEICDSGPLDQPSKVIEYLYAIWRSDKTLLQRPVDRGMATACALEGARHKKSKEEMVQRYLFFRDGWKNGLLNIVYKDLSVFERRFIAKGVQHGGFNSLESLSYFSQEVCLPIEKYTGACWYAPYQLHNPFGDSIHGRDYYRPYQGSWDSYAETVKNVGGVCGSLSNFGAAAAISNGIPAVTMGEPGHCAYAVMTKNDHWQPAYSLSWKRGTHTSFYGSSWAWHILNVKSQKSWATAKESGNLRRLAKQYLKSLDVKKALETVREARKALPAEWKNWQLSIDILKSSNAGNTQWQELHQDVLEYLSPVSGEAAYMMLEKHIYPRVLPKGDDNLVKRRNVLIAFQRSINGWGNARWDYARALQSQLKLLKGKDSHNDAYLTQVFGLHAEKNVFTPLIIEMAFKSIGKDDARKRQLIAGLGKTLKNSKGGDMGKVIDSMAAKVLPDAAKAGDKGSFQYIGKLTAQNYPATKVKTEPFAGILLSSGGTFSIQQPGNRWDNPSRHWGVIEAHGGDFHTASSHATATVQLGNFGKLSGVNIVTRNGNFGRIVGAVLQTSTDGKTWTDVHTFKKAKRIHHIDLSGKKITAGYVRVKQPEKGILHFNLFHVYGKKQN